MLPCGTRLSGKIVEVESYLGSHDKGAHSYGGRRTPRLAPMYEAGGVAYIYHMVREGGREGREGEINISNSGFVTTYKHSMPAPV